MLVRFLAGLVQRLDRRAGQFELAARLDRDCAHTMLFAKADDVLAIHDRLPAEFGLHALQQRRDAGFPIVGNRAVVGAEEGELLVLGADPELLLRLRPCVHIGRHVIEGAERGLVGRVTGHESYLAGRRRRAREGPSQMAD